MSRQFCVPPVALAKVVQDIPGLRVLGDPSTPVRAVTGTSDNVVPDSLFVAIRGGKFDGHRFVADALLRGASAVVVEKPVDAEVTQVVAENSRVALAQLAAALYGHPSRQMRVIGVTGTDGKTTTSHLLDHILASSGRRTALTGSLGAVVAGRPVDVAGTLTTPPADTVQQLLHLMVDARVTDAVVEASSMGLSMHRLDEVAFAAGVVTNISAEHLEYHGGYDAYLNAKAILIQRVVQAGGPVVINHDDAGSQPLLPLIPVAQLSTFGVGPGADVWADPVRVGPAGTRFTLHTPSGAAEVHLPLPGSFNVANALAAAAAAHILGVDQDSIVQALCIAPAVRGRMVAIDEGQPFATYVDYAHTLAAVGTVLRHLRSQHPGGRLIAVTGSGLNPDYWKRRLLAQEVVRHADLAVFCAGDARYENPEQVVAHLAAGARELGAIRGREFVDIVDRRAAITFAVATARPGDVVAILGKGDENCLTTGDQCQGWCEEQVVREAIQRTVDQSARHILK